MSLLRLFVFVLALVAAGVIGWWLSDRLNQPDIDQAAMRVEDQINRIAKLATAEGLYSRMFRYNDKGATDWFPFTDKRVMAQVDARVIYGFSFDSVRVEVDKSANVLRVIGWPEPSELAFEYNSEYFDITEGLFASIDQQDLNTINKAFRERLTKEIDRPKLIQESYEQADDLLEIVRLELEAYDWELIVEGWPAELTKAKE